MCKKQTSVSQFNSIWSHLFGCWFAHGWYSRSRSLGDGYWSTEFFPKPSSTGRPVARQKPNEKSGKRTNTRTKKHSNRDDLKWIHVDHVTTNAKHSHFGAFLYIFEDNESVIKTIIKGRSPTMRLVSRADRVVLDWATWQIQLGPQNPNQICWYHKPICRYSDERQFHPWWMEPPSPSVQHHGHFAVCIWP